MYKVTVSGRISLSVHPTLQQAQLAYRYRGAVTPATAEDIEWVRAMGGYVPALNPPKRPRRKRLGAVKRRHALPATPSGG